MAKHAARKPKTPKDELPELWTPDDIYPALTQKTLTRFREDKRIEWKSARKSLIDLADDYSAFANAQPHGGIIVIGVEDDGAPTGFAKLGGDRLSEFEGVNRSCPDARVESRRFAIVNNKGAPDVALAVRVFYRPDRLVETTRGEAFMRVGKEKRRLSEVEKREIRIAKGEIDYEKEPVSLAYPADFSAELIGQFCASYREKRDIGSGPKNEEILAWCHLGVIAKGEFKPNLACALLFAHDPRAVCPGARIRFQRFSGTTEGSGQAYNLVKDKVIEGPLPLLLAEAERTIADQILEPTALRSGGAFVTEPEYPREVWLEAVVNASVHRSYNFKNMNIFVKMFDDRMVIESPGGFPPPVDEQNLFDFHNPRNPHLMEALYYFGAVKCSHEGTRRMRDAMIGANLPPPEFRQRDIGHHIVQVTLRKRVVATGTSRVDPTATREQRVVEFVRAKGAANVSAVQTFLGCNWRTAKAILTALVDAGELEFVSSSAKRDPTAHYRLTRRRS